MKKDEYDVIIIGAGIGGLVCGCYLAKAGMKVLIIEKKDTAGGCCTSFRKETYIFDACVHSIGSLRKGGYLNTIFDELQLFDKIPLERFNPSDIVLTQKNKISFYSNIQNTIDSLRTAFPNEKKIASFIKYLTQTNPIKLMVSHKGVVFRKVLDKFISNKELKSLISLILLGNSGLTASNIDAFRAIILLREFIFDGGYYPIGGIDKIPNALLARFKEFGGKFVTGVKVNRVNFTKSSYIEVEAEQKIKSKSKRIIANCDMHELIRVVNNSRSFFYDYYKIMQPSLSAFTIYLKRNEKNKSNIIKKANIWIINGINIEEENMSKLINRGLIEDKKVYSLMFLSNETCCIFTNAPFLNFKFWEKHKAFKADKIINKVSKLFPLLNSFSLCAISTPTTILKRTSNWHGAAYGWSSVPNQSFILKKILNSSLQNRLYIVGHWDTQSHGIPGVANSARILSKQILE